MQRQKIISDPTCDQCGEEAEDSLHALWGCQTVKHIWWELNCCRNFLSERFVSFRDLFQGQNNQHMAELFAYMGWSLWFNRNAKRVGFNSLPTDKIFNDAVERLQEYHSVQDYLTRQDVGSHSTQWQPPPHSVYKINFDGATFINTDLAGLGVVAHDSDGMVIASLSKPIRLPPTIADLEALACRRAILFALELGLQDMVFEGDSEVIINHLKTKQPCLTAFGHIIEEARTLSARLRQASYSHTRRKGNKVADKLAKLAKNLYEPQVWMEDIHCNALQYILFDRSLMPI